MGNITPSVDGAEHIGPQQTGDNIEAKRTANYETLDGVTWQRVGTQMAVRIDDTSTADTTYIGKAPIGSSPSSAVWQVSKMDTASGLVKTWADSDALFDNVWDDRTELTYG